MKDQPTYRIGERTYTLLFPELLRPLSDAERQSMRELIRKDGVQVPVVVDEDGGVIDGGNRTQLASECGLQNIPVDVRSGLTLEQKAQLALTLNADRRHLAPAEREQLQRERLDRIARVVEQRRDGESLRAIAEKEGVSHQQVKRDLEQAATVTPVTVQPTTGKVKGRDGKVRPARSRRRPRATPTPTPPAPAPQQEPEAAAAVVTPPAGPAPAPVAPDTSADVVVVQVEAAGEEGAALLKPPPELPAPGPAAPPVRNEVRRLANTLRSLLDEAGRCLKARLADRDRHFRALVEKVGKLAAEHSPIPLEARRGFGDALGQIDEMARLSTSALVHALNGGQLKQVSARLHRYRQAAPHFAAIDGPKQPAGVKPRPDAQPA